MSGPVDTSEGTVTQLAVVMVLDLVKHSSRTAADSSHIQTLVESSLKNASTILRLDDDVSWTYTGDGYFCTFMGGASAKALDFVNIAVPELLQCLGEFHQQFRGGLDIGLVRLKPNQLTGGLEHFDQPGIRAARLEHAADPNSILCTDTFYAVFSHQCSFCFDHTPRSIQTKDCAITAYQVHPKDSSLVQCALYECFFADIPSEQCLEGDRNGILVVEDEPGVMHVISTILPLEVSGCRVIAARDGVEAMGLYSEHRETLALIITDIAMPYMNGSELCRALFKLNVDCPIMVITGFASELDALRNQIPDVALFLPKPFDKRTLMDAIAEVLFWARRNVMRHLELLSDSPRRGLRRLRDAARAFRSVIALTRDDADIAHQMLRHKAKNVVREFLDSLKHGSAFDKSIDLLSSQLQCLVKFSQRINSIGKGETVTYLRAYVDDIKQSKPKLRFKVATNLDEDGAPNLASLNRLILVAVCELIDNATEAVKSDGLIAVRLNYLRTQNTIIASVKDSGPGIPNGEEEKVFQLGYSTRGAGRGYGLFLVSEAAKVFRGYVRCESDNGAQFTIEFPLSRLDR